MGRPISSAHPRLASTIVVNNTNKTRDKGSNEHRYEVIQDTNDHWNWVYILLNTLG